MDSSMIDRINELYHKSKSVGLTEEEKEEQAKLRKNYIEAIRRNMRANLNSISIKEADGSITDLGKNMAESRTSNPRKNQIPLSDESDRVIGRTAGEIEKRAQSRG